MHLMEKSCSLLNSGCLNSKINSAGLESEDEMEQKGDFWETSVTEVANQRLKLVTLPAVIV